MADELEIINADEQQLSTETPFIYLSKEADEITKTLLKENDPAKVKDLTALFELNQKKKNIARANKLSNLLELVDDEVLVRFTCSPESFDNELLLKYMNSTQKTLDEMTTGIVQNPVIQINNQKNEININSGSGLDRESRQKVLNAVMEILENSQNNKEVTAEELEAD